MGLPLQYVGAFGVQDIGAAGISALEVQPHNLGHPQFGEVVETDLHPVGPGHLFQVLNGRRIIKNLELPAQKLQAVFDLPGGGLGQDQLLLLKILGNDLASALQGQQAQNKSHRQQQNH